jgi:hypothetical protein
MFVREPFRAPPGSVTTYEVKYPKGRKPFATLTEAQGFAELVRDDGGWAEINMIVSINVEPRS